MFASACVCLLSFTFIFFVFFYSGLFRFNRLRSQTELVKLNKEMEQESEFIQDMNRQITVLVQKQMRIKSK